MAIFAEITSGSVTNIAVAAAAGNLPAGTWVEIDAISPQPGIGWSYNGSSFTAPAQPAQTLAQKAAAALAAGLAVTSTGTPALNATYAVDDRTATNITGILAANANGISVAAQIAEWPDITGTPHNFSWANYANLVSAILTYRAALQPLIAGAPGSLPTASATIA